MDSTGIAAVGREGRHRTASSVDGDRREAAIGANSEGWDTPRDTFGIASSTTEEIVDLAISISLNIFVACNIDDLSIVGTRSIVNDLNP